MSKAAEKTQQAELLEQWAQALEFSDLAQGRHALKNKDDQYCCLGVAAEKVLGRRFTIQGMEAMAYEGPSVGASLSYLDPEDAKALGLDEEVTDGQLADIEQLLGITLMEENVTWQTLFGMLNDEKELTFSEIAKVVRYLND